MRGEKYPDDDEGAGVEGPEVVGGVGVRLTGKGVGLGVGVGVGRESTETRLNVSLLEKGEGARRG